MRTGSEENDGTAVTTGMRHLTGVAPTNDAHGFFFRCLFDMERSRRPAGGNANALSFPDGFSSMIMTRLIP